MSIVYQVCNYVEYDDAQQQKYDDHVCALQTVWTIIE